MELANNPSAIWVKFHHGSFQLAINQVSSKYSMTNVFTNIIRYKINVFNSFDMKMLSLLLISLFCFSFCPATEKIVNNSKSGFYIFVEDFTDRTNHKYIVETKDSVNTIFKYFFNTELELGDVDRPISIYNGKHSFYIARVTVFKQSNGKKNFRHLKYPNVFHKRSKLNLVIL